MGLLDGKVTFLTGAGRGQGRNHAQRLAKEGSDLILVDIGDGELANPSYPTASSADLKETQRLVEELDRQALTFEVDVRDYDGLVAAVDAGVEHFGHLDCVVANAGMGDTFVPTWEIPVENWKTVLDVNLTGVFYTCKATVPHLRRVGKGASLVLISSTATFRSVGYFAHYTVSKAGVRSLSSTLARELGPDGVRCNSLHPGAILSPMTDALSELSGVSKQEFLNQFLDAQLLPEVGELNDTSAAIVWLLSDEAKHVTGFEMRVDGGEACS